MSLPKKVVKYVVLFFVVLLLIGIVFWGMQWFSNSLGNLYLWKLGMGNSMFQSSLVSSLDAEAQSTPPIPQHLFPLRNWQVSNVDVGAKEAISVEVEPGQALSNSSAQVKVLFNKNETQKLPIASLTKLMTALVVMENYNLSQNVTVSDTAMAQEGEQGDLKAGQVLSVKGLLYISLMESSNRAAYALSEVMGTEKFIALMNSDAQKLGLGNTHFQDVTGLDSASYSTAQDVAALSRYIFENYPLFREITGLKNYNLYLPDGTFHHQLVNTNQLLGSDGIIGGKTGFTDSAKGCFMTIKKSPIQGNYVITIVLGSDDRFGDMQKIIDWLHTAYQWQ
jgi:D-alanyl-D-alanine carboxypeptidase (penicillin-binding protein 5/6)